MAEYDRRFEDNEIDINLRRDSLEALSSIQDPGQKVVLMLLVRSMDSISTKLDRVLADEEKLKHIVLNGSAKNHDAHHRWVENKIKEDYDDSQDKRNISNGIKEKVLLALIMIIVGALGSKYLGL